MEISRVLDNANINICTYFEWKFNFGLNHLSVYAFRDRESAEKIWGQRERESRKIFNTDREGYCHVVCDICRKILFLIEAIISFRGRTCDEDSLWLGTIVLDLTIVLSDSLK